jgi:hypothetical protein
MLGENHGLVYDEKSEECPEIKYDNQTFLKLQKDFLLEFYWTYSYFFPLTRAVKQ